MHMSILFYLNILEYNDVFIRSYSQIHRFYITTTIGGPIIVYFIPDIIFMVISVGMIIPVHIFMIQNS